MADLSDTSIDELLAEVSALEAAGADGAALEAVDFCKIYRSTLRRVLNLAIIILGFARPAIAEALKKIRAFLDAQCPE